MYMQSNKDDAMNFEKDLRNVLLVGFIPSFTTIFIICILDFLCKTIIKVEKAQSCEVTWDLPEGHISWSCGLKNNLGTVTWLSQSEVKKVFAFGKNTNMVWYMDLRTSLWDQKKKLRAIYINNNFLVVKTFGLWLSLKHTAKGH